MENPITKKNIIEFINDSKNNSSFCKEKFPALFKNVEDINFLFIDFIDILDFSQDWIIILFLLKAHSSFLASSCLSTSGQLSDSYCPMRAVIENTLYGFYIWRNPKSIDNWLQRHKNDEVKRKIRAEFTIANLLKELSKSNIKYSEVIKKLYDNTIDYGSHPNVASILTNLEQHKSQNKRSIFMKYFNLDSPFLEATLKDQCHIGMMSIKIFAIIWKHRVEISRLIDKIEKLQNRL